MMHKSKHCNLKMLCYPLLAPKAIGTIAVRFSFLCWLVLLSGQSQVLADDRIEKTKRQPVGIVWRVFASEKKVTIMFNHRPHQWLRKKIYLENMTGNIIAEFSLPKNVTEQSIEQTAKKRPYIIITGFVTYNPTNRSDQNIHVFPKMGYQAVVSDVEKQWVAQPRVENKKHTTNIPFSLPPSRVLPIDNRDMVLIPRGKFVMGSNVNIQDEYPERIAYLDDYYIDKYEVSNGDYLYYLQQSKQITRKIFLDELFVTNEPDDAFARASYAMAEEYCRWAGKALPLEEHWEKAARGPGISRHRTADGSVVFYRQAQDYPWGDVFDLQNCNGHGKSLKPESVYSYESGQSFYGVYNMAGNVMEWTRSWYQAYPDSHYVSSYYGRVYKVLRGGGYLGNRDDLRSSKRQAGGIPSLFADKRGGIRCIYEVKAIDFDGP